MFEMLSRDGLARICEVDILGKKLQTPALLPVVNPKSGPISPKRLSEEFGFKAIITNSYIISKDAALREKALSEGIHRTLSFDDIIMTDSGTFQEYTYGDLRVDPMEIVDFQRDIGSDIGTILDIFSEPTFSRDRTEAAVRTTIDRAKASISRRGDMWLSGPVQGALFPDLREKCARELSAIDLQVHPIGGVVPLMETYRFSELVDVIVASKKGLTPARPVHLFGAGHPMLFPLAVLLGCDMFDSSSYAKFARDGRMMFSDGTYSIQDIPEFWCQCPACSKHSASEVREMDQKDMESVIASHNLYECQAQIRRIRSAILQGTMWDLVERSCSSHPRLIDALRTLKNHNEYLERSEPLSRKGAFMYTGPDSMSRPSLWRYRKRFFERYSQPETEVMVGLPDAQRPYSRTYSSLISRLKSHFIILSNIGPIPIELDETYPLGQIFTPGKAGVCDIENAREFLEDFSHRQRYGIAVVWEGEETESFIKTLDIAHPFDIDRSRVTAVLKLQFGLDAANAVREGEMSFIKSRSTGRIRNILLDGAHLFSIRAEDGYFSLTDEGARRLHAVLASPSYRVEISKDAVPFVRKGSNVFSKFVTGCDESIRPGDEVLIVDEGDTMIGHGRATMNREEMLSFKRGIAVKTRSKGEEQPPADEATS